MVNTVGVSADHWRDFHPLTGYITTLRKFTKGKIHEFSAFSFSFHLMFNQTLSNLIVCLMISQNYIRKLRNELACCSEYQVGLIVDGSRW